VGSLADEDLAYCPQNMWTKSAAWRVAYLSLRPTAQQDIWFRRAAISPNLQALRWHGVSSASATRVSDPGCHHVAVGRKAVTCRSTSPATSVFGAQRKQLVPAAWQGRICGWKTQADLAGRAAGLRGVLSSASHHMDDDGEEAKPLTREQKRIIFIQAAVPMIGFGFMDNMVMIFMGDLIDSTLGVTFGLSTLTAAGFGQIFSDVSGVCFGGTVEALFNKLGLPSAKLSGAQMCMRSTKLVTTLGACIGVIIGCLLGMSTLLFTHDDSTGDAKHDAEFAKMLESEDHVEIKKYMSKLRQELEMAENVIHEAEKTIVVLSPAAKTESQRQAAESSLTMVKVRRTMSNSVPPPHEIETDKALKMLNDQKRGSS
jgi:hypothetical protein